MPATALPWLPTRDEISIILLTVGVASRAVLFGIPLALMLAVALWRLPGPVRVVLNVLINLPLVLPPVVVGWLLLLSFGRRGPVGAWLLAHFGITLPFTTGGAVLACMVMTLPLMVRGFRLGLDAVDPKLLEAARTLGAGPADRFTSITLPIAAPGLMAGIVLAFTACLGEFGAVITFAASIPGETRTLPLAIFAALNDPAGEAMAMRLAIFSLVLAAGGFAVSEIALKRLKL